MEHTFVMLKPDALNRRLIGHITTRFEQKGFKISAMKMMKPSRELLDSHYAEHVSKPWYNGMAEYFASNNVLAMVLSGKNVVNEARRVIGSTNPQEASIGTIRGDFGMDTGRNLVHGSDSLEAAAREIKLWFGEDFVYEPAFDHTLIYERD